MRRTLPILLSLALLTPLAGCFGLVNAMEAENAQLQEENRKLQVRVSTLEDELRTCQEEHDALQIEFGELYDEAQRQRRENAPPTVSRCEPGDDGGYVLREKPFDDIEALTGEARIVPNFADGEVNGMRLSSVRRDTLLASCGLENGDIIRAVNEMPITSPEQGLEAYGAARDADELVFKVIRRGDETTVRIRLLYK